MEDPNDSSGLIVAKATAYETVIDIRALAPFPAAELDAYTAALHEFAGMADALREPPPPQVVETTRRTPKPAKSGKPAKPRRPANPDAPAHHPSHFPPIVQEHWDAVKQECPPHPPGSFPASGAGKWDQWTVPGRQPRQNDEYGRKGVFQDTADKERVE